MKVLLEGEQGELASVRQSWRGEEPSPVCHCTRVDIGSRPKDQVRHLSAASAGSVVGSEARSAVLGKEIKKLAKYDGLIIDEMGYVQQSREEMEVVFTLLAERYERGSVLLTSNLPFSKWEGIFKDAMTTAAAIDRLVHHCVILELNIPSYRMEQAKKNRDASLESGEAN